VTQRQAASDKSAKTAVKRSCHVVRHSATRQLDSTDSELVSGIIDSLRKVELVRQRALGMYAGADDPQSIFDWGL